MKRKMFLLVLTCAIVFSIHAQQIGGGGEAYPNLKTDVEALKKWQKLGFGMFIHWGPVSLKGTEIGWSRGREVPIREYDNLYKKFNPYLFNAEEWVRIAKQAGMKYLIITSKHHDGFCIWDSKHTEYDIMSTPFKRDILQELSEECKKQDVLFGTYYSIADWHHPHYTTRYGGDPRPVEQSDIDQYVDYAKNQIKELVKNYGTNILWFDGEWEDSWNHKNGMDMYQYVRELRSSVLINNRVDKGRQGKHGMSISDKFAGDFGTPEQQVGAFDIEHPWESCITICQQWAWKPNDQMKSAKECIQTLAKTAGGGGNLLLNVGPMPDGRIEQRQIDRLKEIGTWLEENGESIYGTGGGPFKPTKWMVSTFKENSIYLHLFAWPEKQLKLTKFIDAEIISAQILHGAKLSISEKNHQVWIQLPKKQADPIDTVIVLQLNKKASEIKPLEVPENTLTTIQ